jgi:ribosome-binding protein aMBF1 (putative translation factor)
VVISFIEVVCELCGLLVKQLVKIETSAVFVADTSWQTSDSVQRDAQLEHQAPTKVVVATATQINIIVVIQLNIRGK